MMSGQHRDVVAVGASAGGVEALRALEAGEAELNAAGGAPHGSLRITAPSDRSAAICETRAWVSRARGSSKQSLLRQSSTCSGGMACAL